jgi:hypothetical protein
MTPAIGALVTILISAEDKNDNSKGMFPTAHPLAIANLGGDKYWPFASNKLE